MTCPLLPFFPLLLFPLLSFYSFCFSLLLSFPLRYLIKVRANVTPLFSSLLFLGILQQFNVACRYQQQTTDAISALVLDEVGLAEFSPDMPLKVRFLCVGSTGKGLTTLLRYH